MGSRRFFRAFAILIFISASVPALHANITPVNFPTPVPVGALASGVITNIDPVNQRIQIRDARGQILTFRIDNNVLILRNNTPVPLGDLNLGDTVSVTKK